MMYLRMRYPPESHMCDYQRLELDISFKDPLHKRDMVVRTVDKVPDAIKISNDGLFYQLQQPMLQSFCELARAADSGAFIQRFACNTSRMMAGLVKHRIPKRSGHTVTLREPTPMAIAAMHEFLESGTFSEDRAALVDITIEKPGWEWAVKALSTQCNLKVVLLHTTAVDQPTPTMLEIRADRLSVIHAETYYSQPGIRHISHRDAVTASITATVCAADVGVLEIKDIWSVCKATFDNDRVHTVVASGRECRHKFPRLRHLVLHGFHGCDLVDFHNYPQLATIRISDFGPSTSAECARIIKEVPSLHAAPIWYTDSHFKLFAEVTTILRKEAPHLLQTHLRPHTHPWTPMVHRSFGFKTNNLMAALMMGIARLEAAGKVAESDPAALEEVPRSYTKDDTLNIIL